ncbi:MAG: Uma2 family endonuclease [Anaerolineales bacterium]
MTELVVENIFEIDPPDISHIITEDDTPVGNLFSAKQQRLLIEPLYSSWQPLPDVTTQAPRLYLADANVGVFSTIHNPPLVPDMFLSLDVEIAEDWYAKEHRSYFIWEFGKPPDVAVEIVSNTKGQELTKKLREYARMRVGYYVVYDPQQLLQETVLSVYRLHFSKYIPQAEWVLEGVGLGLTLWEGSFEGKTAQWLRWVDLDGQLILTGAERANLEHQRAEAERQRAEEAEARAARLLAQLRAAGIDPEV